MYLGSMVEQGLTAEIYEEPWHPYTKELLRAMLPLDPKKAARQKRLILKENEKSFSGYRKRLSICTEMPVCNGVLPQRKTWKLSVW